MLDLGRYSEAEELLPSGLSEEAGAPEESAKSEAAALADAEELTEFEEDAGDEKDLDEEELEIEPVVADDGPPAQRL